MEPHGFLRATVCVEGLGLPIANATVKIYGEKEKEPYLSLLSDKDGNLKKTPLPCPKRSDRPAYAYYRLEVTAKSFCPFHAIVPIFDGVTSFSSFPLKPEEKM